MMSIDESRRKFLARGAGVAATLMLSPAFGRPLGADVRVVQAATTLQGYADRAVATYNAMQRYFYVGDGSRLYRESSPWSGGNPYSYLWPFSRALIGTLALAGIQPSNLPTSSSVSYIKAVQERLTGLGRYWDGGATPPAYDSYVVAPLGGGGDKYYDDNVWVALALIQQYRLGLTTSLQRAQQLFTFAKSGWDSRVGDRDPGGLFWVQQDSVAGLRNHDRGTGANGGDAELGLHLHELTGSTAYDGDGTVGAKPKALGATNMINWVNKYLVNTSSIGAGLYWNAIRRDGSIDTNLWSYCQGVMVGAKMLGAQVAGSTNYQQAEDTATRTLDYFFKDGNNVASFKVQPPSFNAMFFQNLLLLSSASNNSSLKARILQTIQTYADWAWSDPGTRDPTTGLFYFTDAGQPARGSQAAQLRDQGAMTQLYALLAWNPRDYNKLT